jgi:hypothetical protein
MKPHPKRTNHRARSPHPAPGSALLASGSTVYHRRWPTRRPNRRAIARPSTGSGPTVPRQLDAATHRIARCLTIGTPAGIFCPDILTASDVRSISRTFASRGVRSRSTRKRAGRVHPVAAVRDAPYAARSRSLQRPPATRRSSKLTYVMRSSTRRDALCSIETMF